MALQSVTFTTTVATPPSGTKVAADALAGGEVVQYVKLVDGTADSEAIIPGDATNGLYVNLKASITVPISAASLPLPSGAATSAKQPALGTAGTASADVLTVQGIASMTALKVDGSAVTQPISAASLPLPSGASTSALQTTANTSLTLINTDTTLINTYLGGASRSDDATASLGLLKPLMVGYLFNNSTPDSVDEGDAGAARMSANRNIYMQIRDSAGNERGVNVTASNALTVDGSAVTQPISAASLPLPTSAATSTKQSDGSQKTQIVDGSGNVIGSTSNSLNVNITGGASSGTQYTEDAAAAADPVGNMLIARRRDTPTVSEVSADGDNIALITTAKGELRTRDSDANTTLSALLTDTTFLSAANKVDDAPFTPATTRVLMAGFEFNNSTPDSVDEGDAGAARMSANRNQYIQIRDSAGNERGVNVTASNALVVDGSAVTQPISGSVSISGTPSVDTELPAAATLADGASNLSYPTIGVDVSLFNGTTWDRMRGDITNGLDVDVTRIIPGTSATHLGKAEDAGHTSGDTGVMALAVRRDTFGPGAGTDLDYEALQTNSQGQLRVESGGAPFTIDNNFTRPGDTTTYAAGDAVNNSTSAPTVITLTGIARFTGGGGTIEEVILVDESNATTPGIFYLWITDTTFTPNNDNAAMALSTTILRTVLTVIPLTVNYAASTTGREYISGPISVPFKTSGSANLFCTLQAANAYTPASGGRFDLRVKGHAD